MSLGGGLAVPVHRAGLDMEKNSSRGLGEHLAQTQLPLKGTKLLEMPGGVMWCCFSCPGSRVDRLAASSHPHPREVPVLEQQPLPLEALAEIAEPRRLRCPLGESPGTVRSPSCAKLDLSFIR